MKVFTSHNRVKLMRNITAFLDLTLGVGRGDAPEPGGGASNQMRSQLSRQREQLEKRKEQIDVRGRRIELLQEELGRLKAESSGGVDLSVGEPAVDGEERPGLGLRPGDPHYRAWVGRPENYDLKASMQVSLLLAAGLRETHRLLEVGCGSLRAGRMFIPYLLPGHYYGIEPNRWVLEEGIKHELGEGILKVKKPNFRFVDDFSASEFGVEFDFVLAQSIFSHTYPDMTLLGLERMAESLSPNGKIIANFVERDATTEDGSGWLYPGCTTHTWERMCGMFEECGLVARKISWLPSMRWFVTARPEAADEMDDLADRLRSPLARLKAGGRKIGAEALPGEHDEN